MYPPDGLVRFSKRFLVGSIRPGRERLFKRLAVSGFVSIPAFVAYLVAMYALSSASSAHMSLMVAVWLSGVMLFCGQWAVLTEEGRPLLSAWLQIASLGAWVLMALAASLAVYLWLGRIAAAVCALLATATIAADVYRGRSRASG